MMEIEMSSYSSNMFAFCTGSRFCERVFGPVFGVNDINIVMAGRRGAGKSTVLRQMGLGERVTTCTPAHGFTIETVKYRNVHFTVFDLSGQEEIAADLKPYLSCVHGMIFVIDSSDRGSLGVTKAQLGQLLESSHNKPPLLVLANKQDMPNSMSASEIREKLELTKHRSRYSLNVQSTVATQGHGLDTGFRWLVSALQDNVVTLQCSYTTTLGSGLPIITSDNNVHQIIKT